MQHKLVLLVMHYKWHNKRELCCSPCPKATHSLSLRGGLSLLQWQDLFFDVAKWLFWVQEVRGHPEILISLQEMLSLFSNHQVASFLGQPLLPEWKFFLRKICVYVLRIRWYDTRLSRLHNYQWSIKKKPVVLNSSAAFCTQHVKV